MKSCPTCQLKFIDAQDACPIDDTDLIKVRERAPEGLGKVVGQYKLICQIGEGPMGTVFIGAHPRLERYVAIKTLRQDLEYPAAIARFFETARANGRLHHSHIIESVDLIEDGDDGGFGVFGVFELLRGRSLTSRLTGPLPIDSVIDLAAQIADALGALHSAGAMHRDLAPRNVIVTTRDGRDFIKLTDFGIDQGAHYSMTAYMAPEQAAGAQLDGRADLYALGVVMFEMVTGRHPFPSASDQEYVARHQSDPVPSPSALAPHCPPAVERVIMRCLAKHPDQRPATAAQLVADLRGEQPAAPVATPAAPVRRRRDRGAWIAIGLLAAAGAAAALVLPKYLSSNAPADAAGSISMTALPHEPSPSPSPAPAEPSQPAAPEMVEIAIGSRPAGARVFRAGENAPLGVTPFTTSLLRSDRRAELRFELSGYRTHEVEISFDESHEITVALDKASPSRPAETKPETTPSDRKPDKTNSKLPREGTIDPFAR